MLALLKQNCGVLIQCQLAVVAVFVEHERATRLPERHVDWGCDIERIVALTVGSARIGVPEAVDTASEIRARRSLTQAEDGFLRLKRAGGQPLGAEPLGWIILPQEAPCRCPEAQTSFACNSDFEGWTRELPSARGLLAGDGWAPALGAGQHVGGWFRAGLPTDADGILGQEFDGQSRVQECEIGAMGLSVDLDQRPGRDRLAGRVRGHEPILAVAEQRIANRPEPLGDTGYGAWRQWHPADPPFSEPYP